MKRFAEEKPLMERRLKVARQWISGKWKYGKLGRMRKKHPLDCGNTRCGVCHFHKRFGHQETRQEMFSRQALAEASP